MLGGSSEWWERSSHVVLYFFSSAVNWTLSMTLSIVGRLSRPRSDDPSLYIKPQLSIFYHQAQKCLFKRAMSCKAGSFILFLFAASVTHSDGCKTGRNMFMTLPISFSRFKPRPANHSRTHAVSCAPQPTAPSISFFLLSICCEDITTLYPYRPVC